MQQRRLRLGDILDDYCPRERRITNHAVVAMVEDDVKQTRCTTCDTEHEFKHAKLPVLRRKKDTVSQAYKEVLAAVTSDSTMHAAQAAAAVLPADAPAASTPELPTDRPVELAAAHAERDEAGEQLEAEAAEPQAGADEAGPGELPGNGTGPGEPGEEAGRVHRRLIRATLPRPENQQAQRPVPEFTMRQPQGRAGKFRGRGPGARAAAGARGGGFGNASRPAGRSGSGRGPGARGDFHRPPRAGQGPRRDKKHSK
jgi:hypothetical protein